MEPLIRGICQKCQARVPAEHVIRDGAVLLRKNCPACGPTEAMVTSDEVGWRRKRELWHYEQTTGCSLNCRGCHKDHQPNLVLLDVTNHCNMNCPICIANVPKMGFDFHPPIEYFDKVFKALAQMKPLPMVEFFGGEPTMREDLFLLVTLARRYGLKPRLLTNGLRLADENFCRQVCETGIRVRLAFDGRHPDIYRRLRKANVFDRKMKALENLSRFSTRKNVLLACIARGINEQYLPDLVRCCHEHRHAFDSLGLIPLTENWEPGEFETGLHTTREDVEKMVEACIPGGMVEFVPAGIGEHLRLSRSFFRTNSRSATLMFGGNHPDCEIVTALVSDGTEYRSINHWLRMPFSKVAEEVLLRGRRINPRLSRLDPSRRWQRLRGQIIVLATFLPLVWRAVDPRKLFKRHPLSAGLRMLGGLLRGRKLHDVAYAHMNPPQILQVAVLPFEEPHSVESSRLENCTAVFAYEDVQTGKVRTMSACLWYTYRNEILKQVAQKYGRAPGPGEWVEWNGMRFQMDTLHSSPTVPLNLPATELPVQISCGKGS